MKKAKIILPVILMVALAMGCSSTDNKNTQDSKTESDRDRQDSKDVLDIGNQGSKAISLKGIEMEGIDGKSYTDELFKKSDLTLVNLFTTWCSPCVSEMPELEKLNQEMSGKGVQVVAVVLDAADEITGEKYPDVIETAGQIIKKANASFPVLVPDKTLMNGRLEGISSVPESFFVDSEGNIVSEPYVGSNSFEGWKESAEKELAELKEGK